MLFPPSWIGCLALLVSIPCAVAQLPASAPKIYNVVFLGDSITAGATLPSGAQAPELCAAELRRTLQAEVYFSNQGHSGHTTVDFLPSGNEKSDLALGIAAAESLQAAHAGQLVFSIMLGTNDSANRGPNGSPVTAVNYRMNLKKIIDELLANFPDARIVLNDPTWYSPNTQNSSDYGETGLRRLQTYPRSLDALVSNYSTGKAGHVHRGDTKAFAHFQSNYRTELTPENGQRGTFYLHPNAAGAAKLAGYWAQAIAPALKTPAGFGSR